MNHAEARDLARTLIARARVGDLDAAQVLVDVLASTRMPELGEQLALALQHRHFQNRRSRYYGKPMRMPVLHKESVAIVQEALDIVERRLFGWEECLPLRRDIVHLLTATAPPGYGSYNIDWEVGQVWRRLKEACRALVDADPRAAVYVRQALEKAESLLEGRVFRRHVYTLRGGHYIFDFIEMFGHPHTGGRTLIFDQRRQRFLVADVDQVAAELTHRFGAGERPRRGGP